MGQEKVAPNPSETSHGGTVIGPGWTTSIQYQGQQFTVLTEPAIHMCPIHGPNSVTATGFMTVGGQHVVRQFDKCGCGAYIISGADNTTSDQI